MSLLDKIIQSIINKIQELREKQANCPLSERAYYDEQIAEQYKKLASYQK